MPPDTPDPDVLCPRSPFLVTARLAERLVRSLELNKTSRKKRLFGNKNKALGAKPSETSPAVGKSVIRSVCAEVEVVACSYCTRHGLAEYCQHRGTVVVNQGEDIAVTCSSRVIATGSGACQVKDGVEVNSVGARVSKTSGHNPSAGSCGETSSSGVSSMGSATPDTSPSQSDSSSSSTNHCDSNAASHSKNEAVSYCLNNFPKDPAVTCGAWSLPGVLSSKSAVAGDDVSTLCGDSVVDVNTEFLPESFTPRGKQEAVYVSHTARHGLAEVHKSVPKCSEAVSHCNKPRSVPKDSERTIPSTGRQTAVVELLVIDKKPARSKLNKLKSLGTLKLRRKKRESKTSVRCESVGGVGLVGRQLVDDLLLYGPSGRHGDCDVLNTDVRFLSCRCSTDGVRTCRQPARNGMTGSRTSDNTRLPHGVDLTLAELQEMAARQQQQIEAQQQLLVAKEQRLRFLKQQELRHEQIAAENERLRKLREKVEAQELKLKKLRALRGQVSDHKGNNNNLTAELEMIKSLFNEKEKELSLAVTKVEELTKQLEELRNGHLNGQHADNCNNSPAFLELDKLRKELMVRNKLNEAQNSKLAAHREVMQQRKEEMSTMDMRIAELQQRLRKNRNLQQQQRKEQLAQQGTVGPRGGSLNAKIGTSRPLSANVAAVEPYIKHGTNKDAVIEHQQGYGISKHDPKYQTLPPNIKLLGLDGKKTLDSEPNGNGAATTGGAVEQMDNGHVEKNNNIPAGDSHVDVCTQGDGSNGQGRGSPGKGANDLLPKETVHKVPEFKPSKGHTTAFAVMEEVLKKSGVDGSRSGVVAGSAVSVPLRNVYGPTAYRPPGNLSNFTARPFGSTYSTAMLANRPSIISTEPSQALPNTASGVSVSSPGALFPKTSTPISGVPSNNNNEEMREIFITDAPMSSSMSFAGRLSAYTAASSTIGGSAEILPPQPKYPPLSVSTTDGQHTGGAVMSEVSPRQGDVTRPPQYQIASSRPQQPMHPQRVSDAPSPQLDMSTTQTLPSSQPRQSSSTSSIAATGNKTTSTSSTTSSFMGRATGSSMSEGRPAVPGQISLSMSTKVTLSEHHALDSNTDSVRSTSGSVSQAGQPENNTGYAGSSTTPTPGNVSQQQPADVGSRSEKPILPAERDSKKDITANSVSSALSILMSGPSTTAPATRPFRYAPKSVIANTYMRKLGSNTLDEYRKSMNQIYKDFALTPASTVPSGPERKEPGSPVKTDQPCSAFRGGEPDMAEGPRSSSRASLGDVPPRPQSPPESGMENPPPSPTRSGLPPYPRQTPYEMEAERIRYKANAPKTLRRRLSSGESDDLAHFLPKPQHASPTDTKESSPCTAGSSSRASQQNIVRVDTIQDSYNNNFGSDIHDSQAAMTIYDTPHGDGEQLSPVEVISTPTAKDDNKLSVVCRKKTNLKTKGSIRSVRRVSFDPLALLLDASLEGELELVKRTAREVSDPSAANDEGITALHNAICANHYDIVRFLTEFGCNVNAPDSDGWTPLHCAASCNNLAMVKLLVEHGACIFATTISDHETAAEKCEEDEDGYDGCSEYLYSVQEKLGIVNKGTVYAVFDYSAANPDELGFKDGNSITVLRKGDEQEKDWWWARRGDREGYIPRNLLGSYPRVPLQSQNDER